jgi:hypothetical protein
MYGIPTLPRGVHLLPFSDSRGRTQAVAVDGRGREVARGYVTPGTDPFRARGTNDRLWAALYRTDPR